ncbi:hypothetical protein [Pseudoalteromonas marina]|uniref:Uncharacterized protein n=1 Tax=Pseudoalteromonas marina TaxID=267375 RepID=A0ABT9FCG5_9GAMM|nr:hypothetical protein [Pseudoalteromonas marina]MDP2564474.1 hypothetical protein [Pseudoalteromonas marina]
MKIWFFVAGVYFFHLIAKCVFGYTILETSYQVVFTFIDVFTSLLIFSSLFIMFVIALALNHYKYLARFDPSEDLSSVTSYLNTRFRGLLIAGVCFVVFYILGFIPVLTGHFTVFGFYLSVSAVYCAFVAYATVYSRRPVKKIEGVVS